MSLVAHFRLPHGHSPELLAQAVMHSGALPTAEPVVVGADAESVLYTVALEDAAH